MHRGPTLADWDRFMREINELADEEEAAAIAVALLV